MSKPRNSFGRIKLTEAQMSALETSGVFEGEDDLAKFVHGEKIALTEESMRLVCELSNHLDDIGNSCDVRDDECRKWYRRDARTLGNLYSKMLMRKAA